MPSRLETVSLRFLATHDPVQRPDKQPVHGLNRETGRPRTVALCTSCHNAQPAGALLPRSGAGHLSFTCPLGNGAIHPRDACTRATTPRPTRAWRQQRVARSSLPRAVGARLACTDVRGARAAVQVGLGVSLCCTHNGVTYAWESMRVSPRTVSHLPRHEPQPWRHACPRLTELVTTSAHATTSRADV